MDIHQVHSFIHHSFIHHTFINSIIFLDVMTIDLAPGPNLNLFASGVSSLIDKLIKPQVLKFN